MDHWQTFTDSIKLWWNNKYLWLIGIVGVLMGGASSSTGNFSLPSNYNNSEYQSLSKAIASVPTNVWVVVGIFLLIFGIAWALLSMYLQARSQASLIKSTAEIEKGTRLNFKESWALSKPYYWTLFKQQLLISIPAVVMTLAFASLVIIILVSGGSSNLNSMPQLSLFLICLACPVAILFLLYSLVTSIAYTFGSRISIFKNKGAIAGLKAGLDFFMDHIGDNIIAWLLTLLTSVVLVPIYFILGLVLGIILVVAILGIIAVLIVNLPLGIILAVLVGIFTGFLGSIITGPITAFTNIFWTKVYLALSKRS
jgi:hypothetical protein